MNFQQSLHKVLSNPSFEPPENLFELNLKGNLKDLLKPFPKKILVEFSVGEAKLVLPIFETEYPSNDHPRKAILTAEKWLMANSNAAVASGDAASRAASTAAAASGDAANVFRIVSAAADAADAANATHTTVNAATYAYSTAYFARRANPNISIEDQLKRLFKLVKD